MTTEIISNLSTGTSAGNNRKVLTISLTNNKVLNVLPDNALTPCQHAWTFKSCENYCKQLPIVGIMRTKSAIAGH